MDRRHFLLSTINQDPDNLAVYKDNFTDFDTPNVRHHKGCGVTAKIQKGKYYHIYFSLQVYFKKIYKEKNNFYIWPNNMYNSGIIWRLSWLGYGSEGKIYTDNVEQVLQARVDDLEGKNEENIQYDDTEHGGQIYIRNFRVYEVYDRVTQANSGVINFDCLGSRQILSSNIFFEGATKGKRYCFKGKVTVNTEETNSKWDIRLWAYLRFQYVLRSEHNTKLGITTYDLNLILPASGDVNASATPFNIDMQNFKGTVELTNIQIFEVHDL